MSREQCTQVVVAVVRGGEPQHGFPDALRQPRHRLDFALRGPLDLTHQPRGGDAGQVRGCGGVEVHRGVGVCLQEGRRDIGIDLSLDCPTDDSRLVLAGRDEGDLPCLQNRRDPHGQRLERHVRFTEEVRRRVRARDGVEEDQPGAGGPSRARLVEPDVTAPADPEQLQIDAARFRNGTLERRAMLGAFVTRKVAAQKVDVHLRNIHVIEQVFPHVPVIAVNAIGLHGEILIEVEGDHVLEGEALFAMETDEFTIDAYRGGPRRQSQHRRLSLGRALANQSRDARGKHRGNLVGAFEDADRNPFARGGHPGSGTKVSTIYRGLVASDGTTSTRLLAHAGARKIKCRGAGRSRSANRPPDFSEPAFPRKGGHPSCDERRSLRDGSF